MVIVAGIAVNVPAAGSNSSALASDAPASVDPPAISTRPLPSSAATGSLRCSDIAGSCAEGPRDAVVDLGRGRGPVFAVAAGDEDAAVLERRRAGLRADAGRSVPGCR